ncbi:MAG: hypothetical protein R3F34_18935 [Planctomycetota bacterium]
MSVENAENVVVSMEFDHPITGKITLVSDPRKAAREPKPARPITGQGAESGSE